MPRFGLSGIVVVCFPLGVFTRVEPGDADSLLIECVNPAAYEITQRIRVTNHEVSALDLLELNLPIPQDWPEQKVRGVKTTGDHEFQLRDTHDLGRIVRSRYLTPDSLPGPGESRSLSVRYSLMRTEIRTDIAALQARTNGAYDENSAEFVLFTQAEILIESDGEEIVALAARLDGEANGPVQFARAAYEFVIDHTEYATPSPGHGAVDCLRNGRGDCGSYAALFVALCRAARIPARPVAGCWTLGDSQWHCWAEFLIPDVGWIPVDPSAAERGPRERAYYFGNLDNNRVALAKTFNLTVEAETGSTDLGFVQVGTWWWFPAPGSSGSKITVEHQLLGRAARPVSHGPTR